MSTQLISFPPRLGPQGNFVVQDDDSNDYYAEELGVLLLVRPGERELAPDFGVGDPTFDALDPNEFAAKAEVFGPPVIIHQIKTVPLSDNKQDVTIYFEAADVDELAVRELISDTQEEDAANA